MDQDQDKPQRLKPTTDGKQMTGHSNSTRSKVKRTLHPDDDSSGSQAQQPRLKKQMRLGAKQADKSAGINNDDDATPDSKAVDTNTFDKDTAAQTALQIDLVLESMLLYMNRSDLLRCRIVNKQWQKEATRELRRRKLVIKFSFPHHRYNLRQSIAFQDVCSALSECRTPSLLSSFKVKAVPPNDLGSALVTRFFTTLGNHLKNLTLRLNYARETSAFEISTLMTDLTNLLFRQVPNLEFLDIKFDFPAHLEAELQKLEAFGRNHTDPNDLLLLPNLKTFLVSGSPAPKFFVDVINASDNLSYVGGVWPPLSSIKSCGTAEGGFGDVVELWSSFITYFMRAEGRDKIHLLKSFVLELAVDTRFQYHERDIELMETFLTEHKQNLKLDSFECVPKYDEEGAYYYDPRIVGVINQILECSSGSLKKLKIEPMSWFKKLIIPRLPKLQEICFDCSRSSREWYCGGGFFPRGFNMKNSFPNVSSIVLLRCSADFFRVFVCRMQNEMTEPVPRIRSITLIDEAKECNIDPPLATVTDFRFVFPNLVFISYVGSDKYCDVC